MMRKFILIYTLLFGVVFSNMAYADCNTIAENEEWNDQLENVAAYYEHGDYEESLKIGLEMLQTCEKSPTLNYYISVDYQALGDNNKALEYILKSSDSTQHMATSKANEASIKRKKKELEMIVKGESTDFYKAMREAKREYKLLMWAGAGTAMLGVLFTAFGAGMVASSDKDDTGAICEEDPACINNINNYKSAHTSYTNTNIAGYAMIGAGLATVITGTVLAGVYGYKYKHFKMGDNRLLSFYLTPGGAGLNVSF